ncbi:PREDICTED: uncharacterized protein LOC108556035 [Eufriesea mexicana]|uniref:uncharacterized protein LOC108556035 n=1 Tax=Eufriesea mexicana TaxID=516756 RepID=UPI00083BCC3B|nr:PREDICTED: uncharacterized protein LOC108556035 [Eufriesea mexicana]
MGARTMKVAKRIKRRREQKERALYVRLPHTIRSDEDVAKLFTGNFKVNRLRQSSRYCYVIFSDEKEKNRNLNAVKNTKINGKRVVVAPTVTKIEKKRTIVRKKIVIPKVKADVKVTKNLFISNIKCGTKLQDLKATIPGCLSVKMLKPYSQTSRAAIVRMESGLAAAEYLLNAKARPVLDGRTLRINPDTRTRRRRHKSQPLKIYDGDTEI